MKFKRVVSLMLVLLMTVCLYGCKAFGNDNSTTTTKKMASLEVYQDGEGDNFVSLCWKPLKDAESYKVYLFDDSKGEYTLYKDTKDCFVAVGNLKSSTKYKVKVTTIGKNKSESELEIATKPPALNGLEIVRREINSVIFKWDEIDSADGYDIYLYNNDTNEYDYYASTLNGVGQVEGLSSSSTYKIAVCPYILLDNYKSKGNLISTVIYTDCNAPDVVTVSDRTGDGYKISWSESEKADGYDVSVYDKTTECYVEYKTNMTEREFTVSGLKNGDAKKYMITPYRIVNGEKLKSSDSIYADGVTMLKAVSGSTESFVGGVKVKWVKSNNADGYKVYYSLKKDGEYTFVKKVDATTLSCSISDIGNSVDCYVKVVPFITRSNIDFEGESFVVKGTTFRNDLNDILSSYKQSKSITVTNSDFEVSESRKNRIMSLINGYSDTNKSSFVILDIRSGAMISYNADWYVPTASTIKAPYICYVLTEEIDKGKATMNDILTYKKEFYDPDGSGDIRFHKYGTTYTVKEVIEYILYYSDNCGYLMLQDYFGVDNYNAWLKSIGCKTFINGSSLKWGYVSARDSAKIWVEIYKYMYSGKYGEFFKNELLTTGYSPIRNNLGYLYKVANKFGGATIGWHDTGIVFKGDNPYIMILLTDDSFEHPDNSFQNNMIRQLNALHDELVEYNNQ